MSINKNNTDQTAYRGTLPSIGTQTDDIVDLSEALPSINSGLTQPLRMRADSPVSRVVRVDNITVTNPIHGRRTTIPPIDGLSMPAVSTFTITVDATGAGFATPSSGSALSLGMTASQYLKIGVHLSSAGQISLTKGSAAASLGAATHPAVPTSTFAIGFFYVQTDGSNNIANIAETTITMYAGGGSGGGGGGTGDANAILETLKNAEVDSPYMFLTPGIIATDGTSKIDSLSGATYDVTIGSIVFASNAQNMISVNLTDPVEFQTLTVYPGQVDLTVFWSQLAGYAVPTAFTYEISRNNGVNYNTVLLTRVGSTQVFRGTYAFGVAETAVSVSAISGGTQTDLDLNITTSQQISQRFTLTSQTLVQQVILTLTKTGTPAGNLYLSLVQNNAGVPSTVLTDVLTQSNAYAASSLVTGANTIVLPSTVLPAGTYHFVLSSDATYKSGFSALNKIQVKETNATSGESVYSGVSWSNVSSKAMVSDLQGNIVSLKVKITSAGSPTYPVALDAFALSYYNQSNSYSATIKKRQKFVFTNGATNSFAITAFSPDVDLLCCYCDNTAQVFKVPTFALNGNTAVFPANFFDNGGVSTVFDLTFYQDGGWSFDGADSNARLLAANHLGSASGTDDRSVAGRGIILRNAAGTLIELAIDSSNNITISTVP